MLKITKIFYSIQGEGSFNGTATIFVRLHGCNLACSFCDDELHRGDAYETLHADELLVRLQSYPGNTIVFTGGEPTLYDLTSTITLLQQNGYFVCIETNGYNLQHVANANWITYSPKNLNKLLKDGFNEVKFIVSRETDISKILNYHADMPLYIQPENERHTPHHENVRFCIGLVEQYPRFKLSIQMHKFLGIE
jgi:organic radical activating enzyme